jgi:hypothetical protein
MRIGKTPLRMSFVGGKLPGAGRGCFRLSCVPVEEHDVIRKEWKELLPGVVALDRRDARTFSPMSRLRACFVFAAVLLPAVSLLASERKFDFNSLPLDQPPPGFRSTVAGQGKPGEWKIILDDAPPAIAPISERAVPVSKQAVLAQLARDPANEHFPMLMLDDTTFWDFTLTTRFKIVGGVMDEMAGIAFRIKDESNYYVARASALDGTFRFYRVVNGLRDRLIGPQISIPRGQWQDLKIECAGNSIRCFLNGNEVIPKLTDTTFSSGKIAFWTKSDSISYFTDTVITYPTREIMAQVILRKTLKDYPRVVGLRICAVKPSAKDAVVVASKDEAEINRPGIKVECDAIQKGQAYYVRDKEHGTASIIAPLRDRNGDPVAAVRVVLEAVPGQSEENAVARSQSLLRYMQSQVTTLDELLQ